MDSKMNERIKELARQAGVDFGSVTQDYFGEWFPAITSTEKIDFEKFAELIVKECIEIVEPCKCGCCDGEPEGIITDTIIKQIKEHFGVEE
jgi:hypothetical protein